MQDPSIKIELVSKNTLEGRAFAWQISDDGPLIIKLDKEMFVPGDLPNWSREQVMEQLLIPISAQVIRKLYGK